MGNRSSSAAVAGALLFDAGLRSIGRGSQRRAAYRVSSVRWRARRRAERTGFLTACVVAGAALGTVMVKDLRQARAAQVAADEAATAASAATDGAPTLQGAAQGSTTG